MLRKCRFGSITLIACLHLQAVQAAPDFHIDAGIASWTLNEFARQANLQILFDFAGIEQIITRPINGEMEADEALEALLSGTGLTYDYVNTNTLSILRRPQIDSDTLSRWLQNLEFQAQSWPEGAGPHVTPLIVEIVGADSDENYIATR